MTHRGLCFHFIHYLLAPRMCAIYNAKFHIKMCYLLTNFMVQSPSLETNWFAASQEILPISRNPKFHYRTDKSPPPVSILDQPNSVHIPTSHALRSIHLHLDFPSGLFPSGFPTKILYTTLFSPIRVPCPAYPILYKMCYSIYSENNYYFI